MMLLFCSISFGQQIIFELMAGMIVRPDRLLEYKQVDIQWNMQGLVQANLNDGINYLIDGKYRAATGSFDIRASRQP